MGCSCCPLQQEQTKPNRYHSAQYMHKDAQDWCFFFFSSFFLSLSLSFSKEGCTRACMGQLECRPPCALCHYDSRTSEEIVWLRRQGERSPLPSPATDTTLLCRMGTKRLPAWQCSHRSLQSPATVVLAIMNAKCHPLTPDE